jgi:hypothetical protein
MPDSDQRVDEASTLYGWMGLALSLWQDVENIHYLLFFKLLDAPKPEICSVIYFGVPTFESRRVMVDRVAQYGLADEFKKEWDSLNKRLVAGASARGAIAHYRLSYEIIIESEDPFKVGFGPARLVPAKYNRLAFGKKGPLLLSDLKQHTKDFIALKGNLSEFVRKVPFHPSRQSPNFLSALAPSFASEMSELLMDLFPPSADQSSAQ